VQLLGSTCQLVAERAAGALRNLAGRRNSLKVRNAVAEAGSIPALVFLLRSSQDSVAMHQPSRVQAVAAEVLGCLAEGGHPSIQDAVEAAGGVAALQRLHSSTGDEAFRNAFQFALRHLAPAGSRGTTGALGSSAQPPAAAADGHAARPQPPAAEVAAAMPEHGTAAPAALAEEAKSAQEDAPAVPAVPDVIQQADGSVPPAAVHMAVPAATLPASAAMPRVCSAEGCGNTQGLKRCGG